MKPDETVPVRGWYDTDTGAVEKKDPECDGCVPLVERDAHRLAVMREVAMCLHAQARLLDMEYNHKASGALHTLADALAEGRMPT